MLYSFCFSWSQSKTCFTLLETSTNFLHSLKNRISHRREKNEIVCDAKYQSNKYQNELFMKCMVAKDTTTDKVGNNWIFNG